MVIEKAVCFDEYVNKFDDFFEKNRSQADEVSARIEAETAHLIDIYVTKLDPRFAKLMGDYMADPEHQLRKYREYGEHIFTEFKPLSNFEEPDNSLLYLKWKNSDEFLHVNNRHNFEASLYRGYSFPLVQTEEILNFNFIRSSY